MKLAHANGARFDPPDRADRSPTVDLTADIGPWRLWSRAGIEVCGGLSPEVLVGLMTRHVATFAGDRPQQVFIARQYLAHVSDRRKLSRHIASASEALRKAAMRRAQSSRAEGCQAETPP